MFNKYKIINNEKTLILYIDYLYEFGIDFSKHNKYSSMKNEIKKIIKKINFTGEKIALMVGGILIATILVVENPKVEDKLDLIYVSDNIIPISTIDSKVASNDYIEVIEEVKENPKLEEKNEIIPEKKIENTNKSSLKEANTEIEVNKVETVKEDVVENVLDNSKTVTIYRKNGTVLELDLEEYLIGVVGAEMPASFDMEALKSQAIISRTYALRSMEIGRKLTDDVSTQVYKDNDELRIQWSSSYDKYYAKVKEAVSSTKGLAIYYDNSYIDALFFSTSNGKTEDPKYVWGSEKPYLKSVDSSWDKESNGYLRENAKDLENVLEILGVDSSDFNILSRDESGRVLEISVGNKVFSGVEFRNLLGLRSADFDIEVTGDNIKFITRGYGHGVGLSQYGANGMAKAGYNCYDIIKHYYRNVEIK